MSDTGSDDERVADDPRLELRRLLEQVQQTITDGLRLLGKIGGSGDATGR